MLAGFPRPGASDVVLADGGTVHVRPIEPADAEVASVVADEHQGRGIDTVSLEELAVIGQQEGIARFVADVPLSNGRLLRPSSVADIGASSRPGSVEHTTHIGLGISLFVSVGNKADISGNDSSSTGRTMPTPT